MKTLQNENRLTELMVLQEEIKTMPFGDVWEEYLKREGISKNYIEKETYYNLIYNILPEEIVTKLAYK